MAVIVFCILSVLLFAGKLIRMSIPFLQRLYLPSSVVGGILGLILLSIFREYIPGEWVTAIRSLPGFLINVIFASLFLGTVTPGFKEIFRTAFPQLCMGQILAWGQYVVGLGVTMLLLAPLFGVPFAFGNLLEIGFEGGHGTVGGMTATFKNFKWEDGIALGYTVATAGMILGITLGMVMVNWALNKGIIGSVRTFRERSREERLGLHEETAQPSAGRQTIQCDSLDSLAWHTALIGLAIFGGYGLLHLLRFLERTVLPDATVRIFTGFPLFPLCMIGGILLQIFARKCRVEHLINHGQMQRLSGAALDFLVVSAITTINISVVMQNFLPLLILVVAGLAWSMFCVLFIAPRIFRTAWFEKAIAEFGQSLGVTATGLMLLRTVDPESKTDAAAAFGYKQLLHEPIMGGGLWTAFALTLVFTIGCLPVFLISLAVLLLWGGCAFALARKIRKEK